MKRILFTIVLCLALLALVSCGEPEPKHEHILETLEGIPATCFEPGRSDEVYCISCGETITKGEELPMIDHVPIAGNAIEATCTEGGWTAGLYCDQCGICLEEPQFIKPLGHETVIDPAVSGATCTAAGKNEGSHCERCGEVFLPQSDIFLAHVWGEDDKCAVCQTVLEATEGIEFRHYPEGVVAVLDGIDPNTTSLIIPKEYEGMPVVGVRTDVSKMAKGCEALANLVRVTLPSTVTEIRRYTFADLPKLYDISMTGVVELRDRAFEGCSILSRAVLPNATEIGACAFDGCLSLASISVPNVTEVGTGAFRDCAALTELSLPKGLTSFGNQVFMRCGIETFDGIAGSDKYLVKDNCIVDKETGELLAVTGNAIVPKEATSINKWEQSCCNANVTSLVLHDGITALPEHAFSGCEKLTSVTLPSTLKSIEQYAFFRCALTEIVIPEGVESIGHEAFNVQTLTTVTLPSTLKELAWDAFGTKIATIRYNGTMEQWKAIGDGLFTEPSGEWSYTHDAYTVICTDGELKYDAVVV